MNEVIAHIDISTPTGRRIVRELEKHPKTVKVEQLMADKQNEAPSHKEVFSKLLDDLSEHYKTDMHKLVEL